MNRKLFLKNAALASAALYLPGIAKSVAPQPSDQAAEVFNAGIAGNTTKNLLDRLQADCLDKKPTLTIMMIGTNDMCNGKYVPPQRFRENLTRLCQSISATGSQVLLLSILPFYEPYLLTRHPEAFFKPEGPTGRRDIMNEIVRSVAADVKASFFDVGSVFAKVGKIGLEADSLIRNEANVGKTDGVHPTANGYRFLALAVSDYIRYNRLSTTRIVCFGDSITRGDGSVDKESYPAYLKKLLS